MPEYLLILGGHLTKPQEVSDEQDQEQQAKLVGGCQLVLVETPRIVCLDLAYSKILSTTWKETSRAKFWTILPIVRLVNNVDDE